MERLELGRAKRPEDHKESCQIRGMRKMPMFCGPCVPFR